MRVKQQLSWAKAHMRRAHLCQCAAEGWHAALCPTLQLPAIMRECCKFGTTGKSLLFRRIVSSPSIKNILLYRNGNQVHNSHRSVPTEGCFAIVTIRRARDAMDAAISGACRHGLRKGLCKAPDEGAPRTVKSCGPGAATLALSWWSNPSATGARKAASPGRARISRNTIARGKPGCLGCTCS
jgi:hypothetical protein